MDSDLIEVIKTYATKSRKNLNDLLLGKPKQSIVSILVDLLTCYYNDRNSSTLREFVVVSLSGFKPRPDKIGYNGYRRDRISGNVEHCEAKPKNINTNDPKNKKLNGGGNFTDYTWKRLNRDKKENPVMLTAGFIDGKLVYIFKFPFNSESIVNRLKEQLKRKFPNGDQKGYYLRSASFDLRHYKDIPELSHPFIMEPELLKNYQDYMTGRLYDYLREHA